MQLLEKTQAETNTKAIATKQAGVPDFGRSVNPISTRGGGAEYNPGISDLPTPLI